jgi:hypothetical protein
MNNWTWGDVAKKVGEYAPLLGSAFGPIGTGAGMLVGGAASIVASTLGVKTDPNEVMKKLEADPEAVLKLKQLEMDHEIELQKMALQRDQMALSDVQAQRQFALEYEGKASEIPSSLIWLRSSVRPILTYVITGAYIWGWLGASPQVFTPDRMDMLHSALMLVLFFWFGERMVTRSGIVDVLKRKIGNRKSATETPF